MTKRNETMPCTLCGQPVHANRALFAAHPDGSSHQCHPECYERAYGNPAPADRVRSGRERLTC